MKKNKRNHIDFLFIIKIIHLYTVYSTKKKVKDYFEDVEYYNKFKKKLFQYIKRSNHKTVTYI